MGILIENVERKTHGQDGQATSKIRRSHQLRRTTKTPPFLRATPFVTG
jgi:hypothetical protein